MNLMKLWSRKLPTPKEDVDFDAVDENGTPLWWIGDPNRAWFEVYKRIGELEARLEALEGPPTISSSEITPVVRLDPGRSGKWN